MKEFFFTILYQPLYNFLIFIAWLIPGHSMAWAIIVLTVIIRLALLPSSLKAAKLQVKNMALQPKINKIKAEIKDTKEQSQALMELYKEEGISPFGSCLPLLIQLPILIVLYQVFRGGLTADSFSQLYSFVPHPETVNNLFLGFDLAKPDPWILPIVAGLLQLGLSFLMMPPKPTAEEKKNADPMTMMSRQMMYLLPITTVLFGRAMPAALVIYWIVTTGFSLVQQIYVNKVMKAEREMAALAPKKESVKQIEAPAKTEIEKPKDEKQNMLYKMMNKRLDKQEKKSGVNVTVRTKKR